MAVEANTNVKGRDDERIQLGHRAGPLTRVGAIFAVVGLAACVLLGAFGGAGSRPFFLAYLAGYCFWLSIALGSLFFVLTQHLCRAGWSVSVRRVAECMAATLPVLGVLSLPILVTVAMEKGNPYPWALPLSAASPQPENPDATPEVQEPPGPAPSADLSQAHGLDALTLEKRPYLNPGFFIVRVVGYFLIWSMISLYYWRQSTLQDRTGDVQITARLQAYAGPLLVVWALTGTMAAFDLIMSLEPHWYSTMFGFYYLAGGVLSFFAAIIVLVFLLQRGGWLKHAVTPEHYHDLGKFLFGFTFFWGYIAFAQYMLLWYSSIPEEVEWFAKRGATTVPSQVTGWSYVTIALLFGQILIPFAGLMSRHIKRTTPLLIFWAVWVLTFHFVDMCWAVLPELGPAAHQGLPALAALGAVAGIGGACMAAWVRLAAGHPVRPTRDPRLSEALAFQNI